MTKNLSHPAPFSLRLTQAERQDLEARAGAQPLGAYIKACLFDDALSRRAKPYRADLAQALGLLGQTRSAEHLRALAEAAHMGALPVTPETELQIRQATADIIAMKSALMRELRIKER